MKNWQKSKAGGVSEKSLASFILLPNIPFILMEQKKVPDGEKTSQNSSQGATARFIFLSLRRCSWIPSEEG